LARLGRLPKATQIGDRKKKLLETIELEVARIADLENERVIEESRLKELESLEDPRFYGPDEERPNLPYKEPYRINMGE